MSNLTELAALETALAEIESKKKNARTTRELFLSKYGSLEKFLQIPGKIIDLTNIIRMEGNIQNTEIPLLQSFLKLSEKLFPIEGERETSIGFQQYVEQDKGLYSFPPNERRIIAIVENDEVIGAAVYGVAQTPSEIAELTEVHGAVGITYAMIDSEYQGVGLGKAIVNLVHQKALEFILPNGVENPHLIMGAEVNEWHKMTLGDLVADISGALTLPYGRQNFWNKCGFKPVEELTGYAQIKLREGLSAFNALTYHVSGWEEEQIPSKLVEFLIDYHSKMCLNKQQGLDDADKEVLSNIHHQLSTPMTKLSSKPGDHKQLDKQLLASIFSGLQNGLALDTLMPNVYKQFVGQKGFQPEAMNHS